MLRLPSDIAPNEYRHEVVVPAPVNGKILALSALMSPLYHRGFLGPGCAISTSSSKVLCPFNGVVADCDPLECAITIHAVNGLRIRIKVGANTQRLMGEKCVFLVAPKQKVKRGAPLINISPPWLKQEGIEPVCVVTVLNSKNLTAIVPNSNSRCTAMQDRLFSIFI